MATNNGNDIEKRLWAVANQLWANSGLRPAEFSAPVLGLIFLRYAEKRFAEVEARIGPVGSGARRKVGKADYQAEGVIFLPPEARFSYLQALPEGDNIGRIINDAMGAIEDENPDLTGVLPCGAVGCPNRSKPPPRSTSSKMYHRLALISRSFASPAQRTKVNHKRQCDIEARDDPSMMELALRRAAE